MKSFVFALVSLSLGLTFSVAADAPSWTILFDGTSTDRWKGYRTDAFPAGGWKVEEGVLTSIGGGDRVDIVTRESYTNFELAFEWRVGAHGNSGVFHRMNEEAEASWQAAPELQILSDGPTTKPKHSAGALYDLLPPNDKKTLRPAGEFNTARLIVRDGQVEHWLNGKRILSYDLNSPELKEMIKKSKFGPFKGFAQQETGPIGLQHHGDTVGFRNIRIRELPSSSE